MTIPIWVLAAILSLAGAKVLQTPVGLALKHKVTHASVHVYRAVVPKKPKATPKPKMDCREVEQNVYVCIAPEPVKAKEAHS